MLSVLCPDVIASPVAPLIAWVPHALANVAPEHTDELNALLDGYTLEILDEPAWRCNATPATKTLRLSTGALELLWAQGYASFLLYRWCAAQPGFDGSVVPLDAPDVQTALTGYHWALTRLIGEAKDPPIPPAPWPPSLPHPIADRAVESPHHVADELALVEAGYLLMHEVAHVELRHDFGVAAWSMDQERDADVWAADWVLTRGDPRPDELRKRGIGVALALLVLVTRSIHTGEFGGATHPRTFDRLYNALAHRLPALEMEHVWAMVVAVLSTHLTAANVPIPMGPFDGFAEAVDAIVSSLADRADRRPAE